MSYQPAPYQQPQQPVYYAPPQPAVTHADSVGSWMLTQFVLAIPLVGFIYLLVIAFGGSASVSKKNWAIATLIWMAIGVALAIIGIIIMTVAGVSVWGSVSARPSTYY